MCGDSGGERGSKHHCVCGDSGGGGSKHHCVCVGISNRSYVA